MSDRTPDPANADTPVGIPGLVLIAVGVAAFAVCIVAFTQAWVGTGTWAGIVALLSSAAGLAWLAEEGRRQHGQRPMRPGGGTGSKSA
ncbi:hypothetical protein BVC93_27715 [Mycobacterium sp. MS1601]|uniref:LapA family protein n=1 Tax=Mycobacterium sp. MS1601 TaxID=1936029 RepID=UPI0009797541|nr:LapA family protein [Mycobacterium sp. MS1601]AQA05534.1 hypothetical protein BVC93_27715 [Mycobacterium sp. MS1601]